MSQPLVSVVTPSYNQAEFLGDNIDSVERQRYSNLEHIVVDGESDDGTVDLLKSREDEYNLSWTSEPDNGQSDAINKGFDRADGDIVGWLNSDDVYFEVDTISKVVDYFDRTGADVLYGELCYVDSASTIRGIDVRPDFDSDELAYRSLIGQPAAFFRSEVLDEEQLDREFHYTMDWEFWIRLSKRFEFHHVPWVFAGFRRHEDQKTTDQAAMEKEYQRLRNKHSLPVSSESRSFLFDVAPSELRRTLTAMRLSFQLTRDPPELAFDGDFALLSTMLLNAGPGVHDAQKSLRRWFGR